MNDDEPTIWADEDPVFLEHLVGAIERLERGEKPDLTQIRETHPEIASKLDAALTNMKLLPGLHQAVAAFDPLDGAVIGGRYALGDRLGSGGMGVVYAATDRELQRPVAVKMLRPDLVADPEVEARFAREAEVLATIRSSSVVAVHDRGTTEEGRAYVVMPHLEGRTASELLEVMPKDAGDTAWLREALGDAATLERRYVHQAVAWMETIARGLAEVHAAGVVHRDVKPSNIFVQSDGTPVLIDFGLVTLGSDRTLAARDTALGTPAYMAPEQLDARTEVGPATDVYGVTASLYHLLTAERPYSGSPTQVLAALQRRDPVPAGRLRPGLPRDLQAILDKGMARNPAARYASAAELADDLAAWLDCRPVAARPVSTVRRAFRRAKRSPLAQAVTAVALVLIAVSGVMQWQDWREGVRQAGWNAEWARVPSTVLGSPPHLRVSGSPERERELRAVLDRLVEFAAEPSPARVLRAGYLLDTGEKALAAADWAIVAAHYDTPVCRELAQRYATVTEDAAVSLEDLPEPETDVDRFALAFHWMRVPANEAIRAGELLESCEAGFGITELQLMADAYSVRKRKLSEADQLAVFRRIEQEARRIDIVRGWSSALTAKCIGLGLMGQVRYPEARAAFAGMESLAPYDFTILHNLASSQRESGDFHAARATVDRLIALQPRSTRAHQLKVLIELNLGNFDAARQIADAMPLPDGAPGKAARAQVEGKILLRQAIRALNAQHPSARQLAQSAYDHFTLAREKGSQQISDEMLLALALLNSDDQTPLRVMMQRLARDPHNFVRLRDTKLLLPEDFSAELSAATRAYFEALLRSFAPDFTNDHER